MITQEEAREIALNSVNEAYAVKDDRLVIIDELSREVDLGWLFVYDSWKYLYEDDFDYALAGNDPIVVLRDDGSVHHLGTALDQENALSALRAQLANAEDCGAP
ncbi:MAG: hypothetical protein KDD73_14020 [Anaerolineales bacterium]|nr:hypothetical protein [Anaerolineales bacterium]MCB9172382.1 hypothetical protein [Ardenticatenales bacterium]